MESLLQSILVYLDGRCCRNYPETSEAFSLLLSSRGVFESHLLFDRVRDAHRGRLNQCCRGLLQETLAEELRGSPVTLRSRSGSASAASSEACRCARPPRSGARHSSSRWPSNQSLHRRFVSLSALQRWPLPPLLPATRTIFGRAMNCPSPCAIELDNACCRGQQTLRPQALCPLGDMSPDADGRGAHLAEGGAAVGKRTPLHRHRWPSQRRTTSRARLAEAPGQEA